VLDAQALTVSGIVQRAAVSPLDDVVGDHAVFGRSLWTARSIGQQLLATPTGAPADDEPPLPMFRRLQFLVGDLRCDGQPVMSGGLKLSADRSKLH
jgi:hypothetical protein